MPDLWIRVDADLADNKKVRRLARLLFDSTGDSAEAPAWIALAATEGLLANLWGKVAEHQEDGDLSERDDDQLEEWARWKGAPGRFAQHFRAEMTTHGVITDWEEYQGKLIEHRRKERARWHRRRSGGASAGDSGGASAESPPPDGNGNGNDVEPSSSRTRVMYKGTDTGVAGEYRGDVAALLAAVPNPEAWVAEMRALSEGMHGPQVPPDQLGRAVRDYLAAGAAERAGGPSLRQFRRFVEGAKPPDPRPPRNGKRDDDPPIRTLSLA